MLCVSVVGAPNRPHLGCDSLPPCLCETHWGLRTRSHPHAHVPSPFLPSFPPTSLTSSLYPGEPCKGVALQEREKKSPPFSPLLTSHGGTETRQSDSRALPGLTFLFAGYKAVTEFFGAMGGMQCIKYLMFIFNFLFWVCMYECSVAEALSMP